MSLFEVDGEDFFSMFEGSQDLFDLSEESMNQIINRFDIKSKTILSVGSGRAFEEFWFYKNNCKLTLVDLDEHDSFKKKLEKIPNTESVETLRYITDDANNLKKYTDEKFKIVYFSSFTPNELRNRDVCWIYKKPYLGRLIDKIFRKTNLNFKSLSWPKDKKPFIDIIEKLLENHLADGGLFIFQSYASGVMSNDLTYIDCIKQQLESIDIKLLEVYCFNAYPNIHLIIGLKKSHNSSYQSENVIKTAFKITKFHSRGIPQVNFQGIQKIYDFT